ncbi:MAG: DUF4317 domain-containing protein [Lachnospiraceae bacterium]|nr:DUF4317 domain-containing protein [Lachnospiraceae bacterium]
MTKKDVLELRKRLKKSECTFTRMCGCYVDVDKNQILNFTETFLNLEEDEFFKYLDIAKKTLSGTLGNNLLELEFPLDEEMGEGRQKSLMALKASKLKDENLLNSFYQMIIDTYSYSGNYLILVFHDAYDVITKTSDNAKLDESEEVYEYLLCAICPVSLTKPGLSYLEGEHRIGPRMRDWVVDVPEAGFIFPAFTDRSTDIHSVMYYTKNPKNPHPEFMEEGLGCPSKQTATEQKEIFQNIIKKAVGEDDDTNHQIFMEIQETMNNMIEEQDAIYDKDRDPIVLNADTFQDILESSGVSEEITAKIEKSFTERFADAPPTAENLVDSKAIAANAPIKREQELTRQVLHLQQMLEETKGSAQIINENGDEMVQPVVNDMPEMPSVDEYGVILQVKPEKVEQIRSEIIDGKKYLLVPMEEDEQANVNGVETTL